MNRKETDDCIRSMASGDQASLGLLYDALYQPVFLLCASMVGQALLAEDITQDVFLTVYQYADRYQPGTNPRAWVFGIAKNLCRYHLRRERYRFHGDCTEEQELPAFDPDCLGEIVVAEALSTLSPQEYRVTVLHVYGGLKLREIGEIFHIPYGTVLWQFSQSKKKLRRYYAAAEKRGTDDE